MIFEHNYYGLNRTLCDTLSEMRKCHEARHYGYLVGLIEEAQTYANRMEAALMDKHDIERMHESIKELKVEIKELRVEKHKLEEQINQLKKEVPL
jgi:predicted RNase H-like nuclease (RuvC/YqgF family)